MKNSEKQSTQEKAISTHKTKIEQEAVMVFLESHYKTPISNLVFIGGGEGSQAFSFETGEEKFIIRVNRHSDNGFKKDQYAFSHFGSLKIPVPEIIEIGQLDSGQYFALSKKAEGEVLKNLSTEDFNEITPNLFATLEAIHEVDISEIKGYGKWDIEGNGQYASWKDVLLDVDVFAKTMFGNTFLEKDVWDTVYAKFIELTPYSSEDKQLVHGDYSVANVLASYGEITGVIDWETSMYGDALYDIAWLQFFSKGFDYEKAYRDFCKTIERNIENFDERVLCYQLYIGLGTLSFYVYSNQKDKYDLSKEKLVMLIKN
jgi:hygromycin-B 4-O-kinase